MRRRKRWAAGLLTILIGISLAGFNWPFFGGRREYCPEPEEALAEALAKLEQAQSMESGLVMDMELKLFGFPFNARASVDGVTFRSPRQVKADMELDLGLLGDRQIQVCAREHQKGYELFWKEDEDWRRTMVQEAAVDRLDGQKLMGTFLRQIDEPESMGTQTLQGRRLYQYSGVIHHEGLKKVLIQTGCMELITELLDYDSLQSFSAMLRESTELMESMMDRAEDMPVILSVDAESGYPVQCSMEITKMLREAMEELMGQKSEESSKDHRRKEAEGGRMAGQKSPAGQEQLWEKLRLTKSQIVITCDSFDRAEPFTFPEGAAD